LRSRGRRERQTPLALQHRPTLQRLADDLCDQRRSIRGDQRRKRRLHLRPSSPEREHTVTAFPHARTSPYVERRRNSPAPARPRNSPPLITTLPRDNTVSGIPVTCMPSNIE